MKKKINRYVYTFNSNPQDKQLEKYLASVIKDFDVPIGLIFIKEAKIILSQDSFKTPLNGSLLQGNLYSCGINLAAVPYFKNSIYEPIIFADPNICGKFGIKFYFSVPLLNSNGIELGKVTILDNKKRKLDNLKKLSLKEAASFILEQIIKTY